MPQARRKTPFSGKAKKQQLQAKKNKPLLTNSPPADLSTFQAGAYATSKMGRGARDRYALKFFKESPEAIQLKKEEALQALNPKTEEDLEIVSEKYFPSEVSFPKRPPWTFEMSRAQLDAQEHKSFSEYIMSLEKSPHWKDMSYFELNLETWRQLWRVTEMSDVLLLIVDIRFAGMMFPPSLYEHIVREQNKDMILVLNKIDLVPASAVVAWREYFVRTYPALRVVYFTSCPGYNLRGGTQDKAGLQLRRRKGRLRMSAEGATRLLEACRDIVQGRVDLGSWERKIQDEGSVEFDDERTIVGQTIIETADTSYFKHERFQNGVLTIGCVGQPNVGKSSLMNAIMGKKVVSVSKTPGHTKHFQTIFLTKEVRLCDCPGLVFPSTVPRPVQILMGSYPIAQLREPYTTVRYVAERVDLPRLLRVQHPEGDGEWSPRDVCDGWAKKRGFLTAKAARLDTYRAANDILRMALDGKICLWLRPLGYSSERDELESREEIKYVKWVQALADDDEAPVVSDSEGVSSDDADADDDDDDDEESEDDESEGFTAAMANKFAALGAGD